MKKSTLLQSLSVFALLAAACSPSISHANKDAPIKILSDDSVRAAERLPDFSYAGYNHGVGDIPTAKGKVIDVTEYGVTADDKTNAAISSCAARALVRTEQICTSLALCR